MPGDFLLTGSVTQLIGDTVSAEELASLAGTEIKFRSNIPINQAVPVSGGVMYVAPRTAYVMSDGQLSEDGVNPGIRLLADDPTLGLAEPVQWTIDPGRATVADRNVNLAKWTFTAPAPGDDITLDLATPVPVVEQTGDTRGPRGYPVDDLTYTPGSPGDVQFYSHGLAVGDPVPFVVDVLNYFVNVMDHGAVGDGSTNDTAHVLAAIAALPAGGGCVFFPAGTYLVNTVASGVILKVLNKENVTLLGVGKASIIRTSTATATELLRIDGCTEFTMSGLMLQTTGTANIDKMVHHTCASPGSVHRSTFDNIFIVNLGSTPRYVHDVMTTNASGVIYSGMAQFAAGDVGAVVTIDYGQVAPFRSTISSVQTLSTTLSGSINSSVTTIPLTSALATMPTSGWSLKVGTEHMYVTAGGNTTSLTVIRGRGNDNIHTSHTSGDTAAVYKATLADNVPFDTGDPTAMLRIENATAHFNYGLAIGLDHPGASNMDLANTTLKTVAVSCASIAGVAVGNGVAGNILDHWGYGITIDASGYGLYLNGGSISVHGGDFGNNLVDIKRGQPVTQPLVIDDVRSEGCGQFYHFGGGTTSTQSTTLSNCVVGDIHNEDLVQLQHRTAGSLTLLGCSFYPSFAVQSYTQLIVTGTVANPSALVAINVSHNGPSDNDNPFVTSNTSRQIVGLSRRNTDGEVVSNPIISGSVVTSGSVPASAGATGTEGQIQWDSGFIYVCVATNTWKRAAIAAW